MKLIFSQGYHFYLGPNGPDETENNDAVSGVTSITSSEANPSAASKHHRINSKNVLSTKYTYDESSPLGQNGPYPLYQDYNREAGERE